MMDITDTKQRIGRRRMLARLAGLAASVIGGRAFAQGGRRSTVRGGVTARVPWDERFEVAINFQIGDPRSASRRRPYVAVYIESMDDRAVRTIVLWAQPNRSWLRQLSHWFRGEAARQRTEGGSLITTSSATRRAGSYTVVWDGRNNAGDLVEQGRYYVCIEAVRQNAGSHLVRQDFEFGTEPFTAEIEPYASLTEITVEYRHRQ